MRTLALLDRSQPGARRVALLLAHLDNDRARVGALAGCSRRRDHWLAYLRAATERAALEAALVRARRPWTGRDALSGRRAASPGAARRLRHRRAAAHGHRLAHPRLRRPRRAARGGRGRCRAWIGFAALLLKTTASGARGQRRPAFREEARRRDDEGATRRCAALQDAAGCGRRWPPSPSCRPRRSTTRMGGALRVVAVLPVAAAQLLVVFARAARPTTEIAQGAVRALGDRGRSHRPAARARLAHPPHPRGRVPGHLAQPWRAARAAHRRLEPGRRPHALRGGRPDAVRSTASARRRWACSCARGARGSPQRAARALALATNFRSQAGIVEWVNDAFRRVMLPQREDDREGAVSLAPSPRSTSRSPARPSPCAPVRRRASRAREDEARASSSCVGRRRAERPGRPRSRSSCAPARTSPDRAGAEGRAAALPRRSRSIPSASARSCSDLLALTRALVPPRRPHGVARGAARALVRAHARRPARAGGRRRAHRTSAVGDRATRATAPRGASGDGRARLARVRAVLDDALAGAAARHAARRVEGAWLALGGPACLAGRHGPRGRRRRSSTTSTHRRGRATCADRAALEERLDKLYARAGPGAPRRAAGDDDPQGEGPRVRHRHRARPGPRAARRTRSRSSAGRSAPTAGS